MQFFKQFLQKASAPTKITNGEVWFKTDLKLNLTNVSDVLAHSKDEQQRKVISELGNATQLPEILAHEQQKKLFADLLMRNATPCVSKGMVYGVGSEWTSPVRQHSYYGMNKAVLDSNGAPNPAMVVKLLREINVTIDLKEARLNKLFNHAVVEDFYDNTTPLLVAILQYYYILTIGEKMNTTKHIRSYTRKEVETLVNAEIDKKVSQFAKISKGGPQGLGVPQNDYRLMSRVDILENWFKTTKEESTNMDFDVWLMYEYDDGHSTSGTHFGDHFGFVNNKYMKPDGFHKLQHSFSHLRETPLNLPESDSLIEDLSNWKGHINMTNMSNLDAAIVDRALGGNKRTTPFLIDQDLDLGVRGECIRALMTGRLYSVDCDITARQVLSTFNKLVKSLRVYEEALAAKNLLKYWVCQPGTETVESHWWTMLPRRLVLPALGLKRSIFHCFLEGEAVSLTASALDDYADINNNVEADMLAPSMLSNTAWYWGEYMARNNALDVYEHLRMLMQDDDTSIRSDLRADAMMSAILGTGVRKSLFNGTGTYIPGGLSSHFGIRVRFGKIQMEEVREYGYDLGPNYICMHKLVAPSGVAMITGLAGTLQNGTPYGTTFTTNPIVKRFDKGTWREALNYNDVWAHGVVARWNGHDLEYQHPKHEGRHTVYAANNVTIAMPPVPPSMETAVHSYILRGIFPRHYNFGTNFKWVLDRTLTFRWSRAGSYMLDEPQWRSPAAYVCERPALMGLTIIGSPMTATEYVTTLVCKYDIQTSGFQISLVQSGVVLPQAQGPSELLVTEPEAVPQNTAIGEAADPGIVSTTTG
nr:capsid protein [Helianthus annus leaf-associated totivirus 8]